MTEAETDDRHPEEATVAVAGDLVRGPGLAADHDGGATGTAPDRHREHHRLDDLTLRARRPQDVLDHDVAVDLDGHRPVDATGHEPAEADPEHPRPTRRELGQQHAPAVGPAHLLPADHVGLVEPADGTHRPGGRAGPAPEATGHRPLPAAHVGTRAVGEVDDVDAVAGPVATVAAVRRVHEEVEAGADPVERLALVDDGHGGAAEVEAQALAQPVGVDLVVGDQGDLVAAAQHLGHPSGVLLAAARGGPVAVVDGDLHRRTHQRASSASGTCWRRRRARRSVSIGPSRRRNPTNDTTRRRTTVGRGRWRPSSGRTMSRRA